MAEITRHQLSALLLSALRDRGLGARDLFEGRQEPLSWFFRVVAYDQSELDILESGALDTRKTRFPAATGSNSVPR